MTDLNFPSVSMRQAQSATDHLFDTLYASIISLRLPPGTKMSEVDIARQFNLSRQPVRDAFFRLSKLGFLLIRPQRATVVTRISEKAVLDAVFVRSALESACVRLVAAEHITADLDRLKTNLAHQAAALDDNDPGLFHSLDEAFHRTICEIAGHGHVWTLIREQKAHMDRVRYLTLSTQRRRHVLADHQAIADAIQARDVDMSERLLLDHLNDICSAMSGIRAAHAAHFESDSAWKRS